MTHQHNIKTMKLSRSPHTPAQVQTRAGKAKIAKDSPKISATSSASSTPSLTTSSSLTSSSSTTDVTIILDKIKSQGISLSRQLKSMEENLTTRITAIEQKMKLIDALENNINKLNDRVTVLETFFARVECLEGEVNKIISTTPLNNNNNEDTAFSNNTVCAEITNLKAQIEALNVKNLAADAILIGIPTLAGEILKNIFNNICHTLNLQPPKLCRIFRASQREDSIIIVKFLSAHDKNTTLKAFADFRKRNSRQLILRDIGEDSNAPIYFHESLTKNNRNILRHAIRLRRKHQLFSAFTSSGIVYIKLNNNDVPRTVNSVDMLNSMVETCKRKANTNNNEEEPAENNNNEILINCNNSSPEAEQNNDNKNEASQ